MTNGTVGGVIGGVTGGVMIGKTMGGSYGPNTVEGTSGTYVNGGGTITGGGNKYVGLIQGSGLGNKFGGSGVTGGGVTTPSSNTRHSHASILAQ